MQLTALCNLESGAIADYRATVGRFLFIPLPH